jgi:hypothetical protein
VKLPADVVPCHPKGDSEGWISLDSIQSTPPYLCGLLSVNSTILIIENHAYLCASSSRVANSGSWIITRTTWSHLLGELNALKGVLTQIADLSSCYLRIVLLAGYSVS